MSGDNEAWCLRVGVPDGTQWGKRPTRPPSGVTYFRAVGPAGAGSVCLLDAVDAVAAPP